VRSTENPNSRKRTASSSGISTWAAKTRAAQGVAPAFTKRFKRRRRRHSTSAAVNRSNSAAVTPDSFHAALAGTARIGRKRRAALPLRGDGREQTATALERPDKRPKHAHGLGSMLAGEGRERRHDKRHIVESRLMLLGVALQPANRHLRQPLRFLLAIRIVSSSASAKLIRPSSLAVASATMPRPRRPTPHRLPPSNCAAPCSDCREVRHLSPRLAQAGAAEGLRRSSPTPLTGQDAEWEKLRPWVPREETHERKFPYTPSLGASTDRRGGYAITTKEED
jgi:hypothetical protein